MHCVVISIALVAFIFCSIFYPTESLEHSRLSLLLLLTIPAFQQSRYYLLPCLFSFIENLPDKHKHGRYDTLKRLNRIGVCKRQIGLPENAACSFCHLAELF